MPNHSLLRTQRPTSTVRSIYAWGADKAGTYALGSTAKNYKEPTLIGTLDNLLWIDSNNSTVFIDSSNVAKVSGGNSNGQLSLGDTTRRDSFVTLGGAWIKIKFASTGYAIGLKTDGTLWHAGAKANSKDGAGGTSGTNTTWVQVGTETYWTDFDLGYEQCICLRDNGVPYFFGINGGGQGAQGNYTSPVTTPTVMSGVSNIIKVFCNGGGSLVLNSSGELYTTGASYTNGQSASRNTFARLGSDTYKDVAEGGQTSLGLVVAIKSDDTLKIWGYPISGTPSATYTTPQSFDGSNTYNQVAVSRNQGGQSGICGIRTDGTLWGCGNFTLNGQGNTSGTTSTMEQIGTDNNWLGVVGNADVFLAWK